MLTIGQTQHLTAWPTSHWASRKKHKWHMSMALTQSSMPLGLGLSLPFLLEFLYKKTQNVQKTMSMLRWTNEILSGLGN